MMYNITAGSKVFVKYDAAVGAGTCSKAKATVFKTKVEAEAACKHLRQLMKANGIVVALKIVKIKK